MIDEQPTLRGQGLTRTFGDGATRQYALREVSIDLFRGELALLMGPSGSGKSTLLAIMSGLLQPDQGQVLINEKGKLSDVWKLTPRQREEFRLQNCGFIFQGYNLFPALTARQQLEIVLRWGANATARDARERADAMLTLLGLAKKADLRPLQLSGGEDRKSVV